MYEPYLKYKKDIFCNYITSEQMCNCLKRIFKHLFLDVVIDLHINIDASIVS